MRWKITPLFVAALAASVGSAAAIPATVSSTTPLRAGPGMRSAVVAMIPAGAPVEAGACRDWCRVRYGAAIGFVPSPFVVAAGATPPAAYGYAAPAYDPGPLGLLSAPVDAATGAMDAAGDMFGADDYGAPPAQPPVVAAY